MNNVFPDAFIPGCPDDVSGWDYLQVIYNAIMIIMYSRTPSYPDALMLFQDGIIFHVMTPRAM